MIQTDKIDILFLSETWFHADLLDAQFQLDGYTLLRRDRAQHKTFRRGGGVAVYIRRTIQYRRRHDLEHHEHEVLAMDIATDSRQCPHITLLAYYRPPNDNMLTFCKDLEGTLHFASSNCPVIVVGDFNAKLSTWCSSDDDTREGLLLQDCLDTTGFQQVVTSPTRFSACGSTSSCLDLVFTNVPDLIRDVVVNPPLSDHCPVTANISLPTLPQRDTHSPSVDYGRIDYAALRQHLNTLPLSECMVGATHSDSAWKSWSSYFHQVFNEYVVYHPRRRPTSHRNWEPWMTQPLKKLRARQNRLFRAAKRSGRPADWGVYKLARNSFRNASRRARDAFASQTLTELETKGKRTTKKWWDSAKAMCGLKHRAADLPDLTDTQGQPVSENLDKANTLCAYFASQSQTQSAANVAPAFQCPEDQKLCLQPFTRSTVCHALKSLPLHKSSTGIMNNKVLVETAPVIAASVTRLFNICVSTNTFPREWKLADVRPLYKGKGDPAASSSYRPVSLLHPLGKLLDALVSQQLGHYLRSHKVIGPEQYGFVPGKSTSLQLTKLTHQAALASDQKRSLDVAFLDFTKAFDRVCHSSLLGELSGFATSATVDWFRSYLCERAISVNVNGAKSQPRGITSGVPQGSHLGPMLFTIYANSLPTASDCEAMLFADDTTLAQSRSLQCTVNPELARSIKQVFGWASQRGGAFNPDKSEIVSFTRSPTCPALAPPLEVSGSILSAVTAHRHLGLLLRSDLKWTDQVNLVLGTFRKRINLLSYMATRLSPFAIKQLYQCWVRPTAEYCSPIWSTGMQVAQITTLERLQARVCRKLLYRKKIVPALTTPKEELFQRAGLSSLLWRRQIDSLVALHSLACRHPEVLTELGFVISNSERRPRFLRLPRLGPAIGGLFISKTVPVWNSLPPELRQVNSTKLFRTQLKKHFADHQFCKSGVPGFAAHYQ